MVKQVLQHLLLFLSSIFIGQDLSLFIFLFNLFVQVCLGIPQNQNPFKLWSLALKGSTDPSGNGVVEAIKNEVQHPPSNTAGTLAQHRRDLNAYIACKSKNTTAWVTLLNIVQNDLLDWFEEYEITYSL